MKKRLLLSLLSIMLVSCVAFGFSLTSVSADEANPSASITWTNKIENSFTANEDGSVLTVGSAQTHWADAIAYTDDLVEGISLPYYVEARVQGLQASSETRLGIVALKNEATFIRSHVCIRNGVFADMSHFGWLHDYISADSKDTGWQSIVNYDRWGFTADYTDFTIGVKYWIAENGHFFAELYVNGNLIPGSQYDLTDKHGVNDVTGPWKFGIFFHDSTEVVQTATFSEFKVEQLEEPAKEEDKIEWTNKVPNAFAVNEDGSVLTTGAGQTNFGDAIAYTDDLTAGITSAYYVEARVQGLQASSETRLGIVALKNEATFIRSHVCIRNGAFADMSHFGWLHDYISGDSKDTGWQSIVNYDRWGFTADYTDFTIGAKYWMAENGHFCAELYVNGNLIPGSQYDLTDKHGVDDVTGAWNVGVYLFDSEGNQTATFSDFKVEVIKEEAPVVETNWINKVENSFVPSEDDSVLTVGSAQTVWADAIAYNPELTKGISFPYYVEARVQGIQPSNETRLGIVALKNEVTFIRTHVCLRNGAFADMSHFGWLNDYINGDNKDTGWQSIVNYADWKLTADYTDFTIGAKYWIDENGHYWVQTYVNGNLIPGSEYDLTAKHGVAGVTEPWNFGVFFCDQTSVNQTATFSEFKVQQLEGESGGNEDDHMFDGYEWDYSSLWTNNGETLSTSNSGWRNNFLVTGANEQLKGSYVVSYTFQGTREEITHIDGTDDDFTRFGVMPWYIDNNTFIVVELVWKASEAPYLTNICLQVNGKDPNGLAAGDPEWNDCWVVNWQEEGSVRELLPKDEITLTIARLTHEFYDQYAIYVNGKYVTTYNIFLSATYGDAVAKTGMLTRGDTLTLKNFEIINPTENDKPVISGHEDAITTGMVGESVRVPSNLEATGFMGCRVECVVTVTGPNGEAVSVKANKFMPEVAGNYVVTISATDPWGATSEVEYTVTVAGVEQPDNSSSSDSELSSCKSSVGTGSAFVVLMAMAVCGIIRKRNK